jgi:hypothetical protein
MPQASQLLGVEERRGNSQEEDGWQSASRSSRPGEPQVMSQRLYRYRVTWKDGYSMIVWAWDAKDAASLGGLTRWKYNAEKAKICGVEIEEVEP